MLDFCLYIKAQVNRVYLRFRDVNISLSALFTLFIIIFIVD